MKDIDFDELDRAVSSVLEPVADSTPTTAAAGATTPSAPQPAAPETTSAPDVAPIASEPTATVPVTTESEAPTAAATKTPLAIKRRGQFMDVVHPSSDMTNKSEETVATPPRKVTLQPLSTSVTPEADSPTTPEVEETPVSEPATPVVIETPVVEPQAPVETVEPTPAERAMPDPLDVMQTHEEANDAASTETSTIEDVPVNASDAVEGTPAEAETTPATPFLTDTKVDKRPLDAFSADEGEAEAPAELAPDPVAATEPLPPELQADVIAVEANPSDHMEPAAEKEPVTDDKKEEEGTGFNASIPQQYASTEGKPDDDHSIFDTSEYHQPLAPVKPKKRGLPGWLVVLLIMILLAGLSAAGGYLWFHYEL